MDGVSCVTFARKDSDAPALSSKAASSSVAGGLRIGPSDDAYEQEADRVANEVMSVSAAKRHWSLPSPSGGGSLQRKCSCGASGGSSSECEECKQEKEGKMLQRKTARPAESGVAPPIVHKVLDSPGQPLDRATREFFEPRFGYDFSRVRVHTGGHAAESANAVGALAYTVGQNLVFAGSQYSPHSPAGRKLLSHELAHVLQQSGGDLGLVRKGNGPPQVTSARESVQRQCSPAPCPAAAYPLIAEPPIPKQAEQCLQEQYEATHPNSKRGVSLGFNLGWIKLTGRDLAERQALTCLRGGTTAKAGPHFTAKHGMYAAQPDIWDFSNRTMYEITTAGWATFKSGTTGKLGAQIKLANDITGVPECGGLMFSPGGWAPPTQCSLLPSGVYISTVNVGGVLVYTPLKEASKELTFLALMAMLAALLKKGGGGAVGKKLAGQAAGKAVPVYAIAGLVATAVLLSSGKAQAKLGPGDEDPIAQLFKSLAQQGTPVPPEIQQLIESDPELKAKLDAALKKGGDASAAQKELNEKILKIMADNPDQFTKEDLEKILTMTAIAGKALPNGSVTADKVRKMLDQKEGSGGSGEGKAEKPEAAPAPSPAEPPPQQAAPPQKDKPTAAEKGPGSGAGMPPPAVPDNEKYPSLSDDSIKKIAAANAPVKSLWDAVVSRSGEGPKVTDALTNQFFQIVQPGLTSDQAQELIQHLAPAGQMSGEEALATIKAGIEQLQKKKEEQEAAAAESVVASIEPGKAAKKDAQQDSELINKLADLATKGNFSGISPGQLDLTWSKEVEGRINATLKVVTKEGIKGAGRVTGQIKHRDGKKLTIVIVASTPIVAGDGTILREARTVVGNTDIYTLGDKSKRTEPVGSPRQSPKEGR
jgi:hypothetical protein